MGAWCSSPPAASKGGDVVLDAAFPVLIRGAKGLRDADGGGESDPYCLCKVGPVGSTWEEKDDRTLRRSHFKQGQSAPVWNFAVAYGKDLVAGAELEVRVRDEDHLGSHDDLGSVRVPISQLETHVGELRDYDLTGDQATGSIALMTGPRVEDALLEQVKEGPSRGADTSDVLWWWSVAEALGQFVSLKANLAKYYFEMLGFLAAGQLPGATGLRNWFLRRSSDRKGRDTYRWAGPFPENCITYSGHAEVAEKLRSLGQRLGTNDNDGDAYRGNFLGFQLLNGALWPEKADRVIGLAETQQSHAFCRAVIAKLVGPPPEGRWTPELVRQMAAGFWRGRTSVSSDDFKPWTTQVLHKIHLGLDLTWEEAQDFTKFQSRALLIIPFPGLTPDNALWGTLGIDKVLATKAEWLARYKAALREILPEEARAWSGEQLTLAASFVMDSLLFAGGASVPTVLSYCMAVPWTAWGRDNLPASFKLRRSTIWPYVMETVRRFPPVAGVPYRDRSFGGSKPDQDVFCNVMMTAFDPRVWKDHEKFILRPLEDYARNSLLWAEAAMAPDNASPNSHACPAKDLSVRMPVEFLTGFLQAALGSDEQVQKDAPLDFSTWEISPDSVIINEYQPLPSFTLQRKGS
uniref:C2 domain-containing protein n=1 Tax=Alexandrium catenella TaxID=2925 RepID=A0A7S1WSW0_ALECA